MFPVSYFKKKFLFSPLLYSIPIFPPSGTIAVSAYHTFSSKWRTKSKKMLLARRKFCMRFLCCSAKVAQCYRHKIRQIHKQYIVESTAKYLQFKGTGTNKEALCSFYRFGLVLCAKYNLLVFCCFNADSFFDPAQL